MSQPIKAITIWQPWATLMALNEKTIETRGRRYPWERHRGLLAIHAAAKWINRALAWHIRFDDGDWLAIRAALQKHGAWPPENLPLGKVLCVRKMVDFRPTEELRADPIYHNDLPFGNYSRYRFGLVTEPLIPFAEPIPARGQQGLWNWEMPT